MPHARVAMSFGISTSNQKVVCEPRRMPAVSTKNVFHLLLDMLRMICCTERTCLKLEVCLSEPRIAQRCKPWRSGADSRLFMISTHRLWSDPTLVIFCIKQRERRGLAACVKTSCLRKIDILAWSLNPWNSKRKNTECLEFIGDVLFLANKMVAN